MTREGGPAVVATPALRRWAVEVLTRDGVQPMLAKLHPDVRNAIAVLVQSEANRREDEPTARVEVPR